MSSQQPEPQQENPDPRVMIINADGAPATPAAPGAEPVGEEVTDLIEEPAKVMRIGSMIRMLLEEVKAAPVDEAGRTRLATVLSTAISELKQGLAPELGNELDRLITPLSGATPSESELRIAQAQLVGWLEGLFHGIQTAIYAQQMAARAQLEQMQKALPPGLSSTEVGGPNDLTAASENSSGGMYL
ncbi:MAG: bacterial proteasome activator family protein [Propionibacteriales bacterium]|nr:bacterial proteasome activator family protein [Propionibacteriales bacterium]